MPENFNICDDVLIALRRVIRAVDIHSKRLVNTYGLTSPQALILKEISTSDQLTAADLAKRITLSQATVTDILNRLEKRNLIRRVRSEQDRRKSFIKTTPQATDLINKAPPILQERFVQRFNRLERWEQSQLLASLQRIASMMDAESIDASPVISIGALQSQSDVADKKR